MSIWIVLLAAVSVSFAVGGLWYSPVLFGKAWNAEDACPTLVLTDSGTGFTEQEGRQLFAWYSRT